jgi:hypothetical protein
MNLHCFVAQIEWLLFAGVIEGIQLLTLRQQLQRYVKGSISDAQMQMLINDVDPDPEPCYWEDISAYPDWF